MFGLAVQCLPRRGPQKLEFVYLRMSDLKVRPRTHPPQSRKAQACGNWRSRVFLLCQDGLICKDRKKAVNAKTKTYNSGYSLVVTHLTTNPPVRCLNRAERTGSLVFNVLWSYVTVLAILSIILYSSQPARALKCSRRSPQIDGQTLKHVRQLPAIWIHSEQTRSDHQTPVIAYFPAQAAPAHRLVPNGRIQDMHRLPHRLASLLFSIKLAFSVHRWEMQMKGKEWNPRTDPGC